MPIDIRDPDDARIEAYREVRERDLAGRDNLFIAEGEVVLRVLVRQRRFSIRSLLLAENRIGPLADIVEQLGPDIPVYRASREVMDAIVGFPIHRGALAAVSRGQALSPADILETLPPRALALGLVGVANHDNMGGLFRNAAAFGAGAVLMDSTCCDPLYRKAIRVSVGGALAVPFARCGSAGEMVGLFRRAGFEIVSLSPSGREPLRAIRPGRRCALLLGAEGPGLPAEILASTRSVTIPMQGGFDSLNVATASGVALYELSAGLSDS